MPKALTLFLGLSTLARTFSEKPPPLLREKPPKMRLPQVDGRRCLFEQSSKAAACDWLGLPQEVVIECPNGLNRDHPGVKYSSSLLLGDVPRVGDPFH